MAARVDRDEPGDDLAEDLAEDGLTPAPEIETEDYTDFLAQRAAAFGNLALKLEHIHDAAARAAGLDMLRALSRFVKVTAPATLTRVK